MLFMQPCLPGGAKQVKKDLTLKKALLMKKRATKPSTYDIGLAISLPDKVMALTELTIDQVFASLTVEQMEELKDTFKHGKAHVDKKVLDVYAMMKDGTDMQTVIDRFETAMSHLQSLVFEAFVRHFGDPESGSMKVGDIINAIEVKIAVAKALARRARGSDSMEM
jgi:hypothetical protein